jgi:hypothetical protein
MRDPLTLSNMILFYLFTRFTFYSLNLFISYIYYYLFTTILFYLMIYLIIFFILFYLLIALVCVACVG